MTSQCVHKKSTPMQTFVTIVGMAPAAMFIVMVFCLSDFTNGCVAIVSAIVGLALAKYIFTYMQYGHKKVARGR